MQTLLIKIATVIAYIAMVTVNFLANALPINNRDTGTISDAYPNLFAPAGLTFSIWGLIYLLLAGYVIHFCLSQEKIPTSKKALHLKHVAILFIATSLANISWIFAWHYDIIGLSVFIMAILLALLIRIADILRQEQLNTREKICIVLPFSIYFGWITVATIANITVFLVSVGWNGFGIADFIWTSIILFIGALIGILRMHKDKNVAYGLVLIWAYLGILLKHLSPEGFDGQYPSIIASVILCLLLFVFFTGKVFYRKQ